MRIIHLAVADGFAEAGQIDLLTRGATNRDESHEVWWLVDPTSPTRQSDCLADLPQRTFSFRGTCDVLATWRLHRALRSGPIDVIHVWGLEAARLVGLARVPRALPCVVTLNEIRLRTNDLCGRPWPRTLQHVLQRERTKIVATHRQLSDWFKQSATGEQPTVVPYAMPNVSYDPPGHEGGADGRRAEDAGMDQHPDVLPMRSLATLKRSGTGSRPDGEAIRRELGLSTDVPLIATIGSLAEDQRIGELIWAACVLQNVQEFGLLILGDGPQKTRLEQCNRNTRTTRSVVFLGAREDRGRILKECLCYWSAFAGAGVDAGLLEAQSAGLPVVATDTPGHRVLVDDGRNGYLIRVDRSADFARRTRRFLADRRLAARLGEAGRQSVNRDFGRVQSVSAYQALYREVA